MIDRFERFSFAISEISRLWHKIATEEMKKYGLKGAHSLYLAAMHRFPDGITAPKLGELCGKDKADVSRMMSIMEKKGLVKKEGIHQKLYRGTYLLTDEGKIAAEYVCRRSSLIVDAAGKGLTDEEREKIYEILNLIAGNLRDISENGLDSEDIFQ